MMELPMWGEQNPAYDPPAIFFLEKRKRGLDNGRQRSQRYLSQPLNNISNPQESKNAIYTNRKVAISIHLRPDSARGGMLLFLLALR